METAKMFDLEEYFHLALHASSVGQPHACMTYLKEILRQQPEHAPAIYLLAVQYAELGLFDRAVRGMNAALAIDPSLEVPRFQLGLLLLDRNRRAEAKESFSALSGSTDAALRLFAAGMIGLADNDTRLAREKITLGLAAASSNPGLKALMQRIHEGLERSDQAKASAPEALGNLVSLGAYGVAPGESGMFLHK